MKQGQLNILGDALDLYLNRNCTNRADITSIDVGKVLDITYEQAKFIIDCRERFHDMGFLSTDKLLDFFIEWNERIKKRENGSKKSISFQKKAVAHFQKQLEAGAHHGLIDEIRFIKSVISEHESCKYQIRFEDLGKVDLKIFEIDEAFADSYLITIERGEYKLAEALIAFSGFIDYKIAERIKKIIYSDSVNARAALLKCLASDKNIDEKKNLIYYLTILEDGYSDDLPFKNAIYTLVAKSSIVDAYDKLDVDFFSKLFRYARTNRDPIINFIDKVSPSEMKESDILYLDEILKVDSVMTSNGTSFLGPYVYVPKRYARRLFDIQKDFFCKYKNDTLNGHDFYGTATMYNSVQNDSQACFINLCFNDLFNDKDNVVPIETLSKLLEGLFEKNGCKDYSVNEEYAVLRNIVINLKCGLASEKDNNNWKHYLNLSYLCGHISRKKDRLFKLRCVNEILRSTSLSVEDTARMVKYVCEAKDERQAFAYTYVASHNAMFIGDDVVTGRLSIEIQGKGMLGYDTAHNYLLPEYKNSLIQTNVGNTGIFRRVSRDEYLSSMIKSSPFWRFNVFSSFDAEDKDMAMCDTLLVGYKFNIPNPIKDKPKTFVIE